MNVLSAKVIFRERSAVDILDLAVRFLVVHGGAFARLSGMVLLPCFVISLVVAKTVDWFVAWIVAVTLGFLAQVPFTLLASRLVFQDRVRTREVLKEAISSTPKILMMRVLTTVGIAASSFFFIIPALYLASVLFFMNEVVLLERATLGQSLGRAQKVAASSLGDAFVGVLIVTVLPALAVVLSEVGGRMILGELLQFQPPRPAWEEGGSSLCLFGWFAMIPYVTTSRFFMYLNVRTRAEGWDIQTRFAAIAALAEAEMGEAS